MATWYVDLEGGNDGNSGNSYANRRKTISAVTASDLSPGDTIRVMASKDPESLGINATFTNKSATVTLASALNILIDECDAAWTASTNVTSTADTAVRRSGTGAAKHVIASGFTTGLASYHATGALNLSSYQGITLWVQVSAALAASTLSIRLCSDTAGVTTVDTLALPAITQSGQWIPVYIDKGSALGASIQSVALYADLDPGTITVYLDNVSSVKASSGTDALTLRSLIGKNTSGETFWGIRTINGTSLTLDCYPSMSVSGASRGYSGATATVAAYHRTPIATPLVATSTTAVGAIAEAGTAGNQNVVSGGWDRTNMSTQPGETWCDGSSGFGYGFNCARDYTTINNLSFVRYNYGYTTTSSPASPMIGVTGSTCHFNNCASYGIWITNSTAPLNLGTIICAGNGSSTQGAMVNSAQILGNTITSLTALSSGPTGGITSGVIFSGYYTTIGTIVANNNAWVGLTFGTGGTTSNLSITTLTCNDNSSVGVGYGASSSAFNVRFGTVTCSGNGSYGISIDGQFYRGWKSLVIDSITSTSNVNAGVNLGPSSGVILKSVTTSGNSGGGIACNGILDDFVYVLASSLAEGTKFQAFVTTAINSGVVFRNFNGTAGDHRIYLGTHGTIFSETSTRHTASGLSWKFSPLLTAYVSATTPIRKTMARVVCAASSLVTVKAWCRRTDTGLTASLVCPGGQIGGVAADVTASISVAANTWEELTITFTPSETGTVEIEYQVYGGSTYSAYIDDLTISQA